MLTEACSTCPVPISSYKMRGTGFDTERRQALAAKFSGTVPKTKTRWIASYRYTGSRHLTPVDEFNTSPGQAGSLFEPLHPATDPGQLPRRTHGSSDGPAKSPRARLCPRHGPDGRTLYLVQSARSARGGVAFNF